MISYPAEGSNLKNNSLAFGAMPSSFLYAAAFRWVILSKIKIDLRLLFITKDHLHS